MVVDNIEIGYIRKVEILLHVYIFVNDSSGKFFQDQLFGAKCEGTG